MGVEPTSERVATEVTTSVSSFFVLPLEIDRYSSFLNIVGIYIFAQSLILTLCKIHFFVQGLIWG